MHALAYAKALEELTGVDVKKMLPIPNIPAVSSPGLHPGEIAEVVQKLVGRM